MAPTITPVTTIAMDSTMEWNITCPLIGTTILEAAQIVEQSMFEGMSDNVNGLTSTYVYEICGEEVSEHSPYPSGRRLQTAASEVRATVVVSTTCNGCGDEMFDEADNALTMILEDGSLTGLVQGNSGGVIEAVFDPDVLITTSQNITNPPTKAPTTPPTDEPSNSPVTAAPTPAPFVPEAPPEPTPRPTPKPTVTSKSGKNSKTQTASPTKNSKSVKVVKAL